MLFSRALIMILNKSDSLGIGVFEDDSEINVGKV